MSEILNVLRSFCCGEFNAVGGKSALEHDKGLLAMREGTGVVA